MPEKNDAIRIHPTAMAFPPLPAKEMKELKEDIQKNGIRMPLLFNTEESVLIDGRNRWYIAQDLGIPKSKLPIEHFKGSDEEVTSVILSRNLFRRHLTDKARAALVVKFLAPKLQAEAKERQNKARSGGLKENAGQGRTVEKLAESAQTSRHAIEQAMRVRGAGGEAALDEIISGKADLTKKAASVKTTPRKPKKAPPFEEAVWRRWSNFLTYWSPVQRGKAKDLIRDWLKPGSKDPY